MFKVSQISRYASRSLLKGAWQTGPKFCVQWIQEKLGQHTRQMNLFISY